MKELRLGLIARDIHNSVSPEVNRALGADIGYAVSFEIFDVEPEMLAAQMAYGREYLHGFTVTMPHKQAALRHVDEMDESAERCGSANTVLVRDGRLIAYNTDGWGLMKFFAMEGIPLKNRKVVMLGAGGAGLSIAYNLGLQGAGDVRVVNICLGQAEALCARFGKGFTPVAFTEQSLSESCRGADIFINASVLGQVGYGDFESLDFLHSLKKDAVVFDVNYSNPDAKLPPAARAAGLRSYAGRPMTVCQGIRAMEIWTGRTPSDEAASELIRRLGK